MSAIDSLGSLANQSSSTDAFSALTSGEFLKIIFTELTNQDPLEPNGTKEMINQLSSLRSIESDTQMVESLQSLARQTEFASASQLVGSLVSGVTLDNRRVADLVISVSNTPDGPVLNLFDGSRMFFRNVDEIVGPIDDPTDPNGGPDDGPNDGPDDIPDGSGDDSTHVPDATGKIIPGDTNIDIIPGVGIDPVHKTVSIDV